MLYWLALCQYTLLGVRESVLGLTGSVSVYPARCQGVSALLTGSVSVYPLGVRESVLYWLAQWQYTLLGVRESVLGLTGSVSVYPARCQGVSALLTGSVSVYPLGVRESVLYWLAQCQYALLGFRESALLTGSVSVYPARWLVSWGQCFTDWLSVSIPC